MPKFVIIEQTAVSEGGHYFGYTSCIAEAAARYGLDVVILANQNLRSDFCCDGVTTYRTFTYNWWEADRERKTDWGPGNLAYELVERLRLIGITAEDHILLHTLGVIELQIILEYLSSINIPEALPHYHILLRYDSESLEVELDRYQRLFEKLYSSPCRRSRVHFYSDTHLLAHQYSLLFRIPFGTAPIPFAQQFLIEAQRSLPERPATAPLTAVYLGDARIEKGYLWLPAAIAKVWQSHCLTGRVRFRVQSNFNVPQGEPGILEASQRIAQYPPNIVSLMREPLSAADYYRELAAADIVLVPYSPQRYRFRSSGILVESATAGKVIVTSAGSWMETQVSPNQATFFTTSADFGSAIGKAVDQFQQLSAVARMRQPEMLKRSSPTNFVRHITDSRTSELLPAPDAPRVLFIMNGDAMVQKNGASRIAHMQLKYLTERRWNVIGLFLSYEEPAVPGPPSAWIDALQECVSPYFFENIFIAGPGRWNLDHRRLRTLRQRREQGEFSIEMDLETVACFDLNPDLIYAIHLHRPNLIFINYVTNLRIVDALGLTGVPVVCEIHDIQSFQKAIYGKRQVSESDLDLEFNLLSRCQMLISLSHSETEYILARLPAAHIVTTGIFLDQLQRKVAALAGIKDLAELVSSGRPVLPQYQLETARETGETSEIHRLTNIDSMDLLFVSSAHHANVSGLVWFLEEIYKPLLAPLGISMFVVGDIAHSRQWPSHERLFFVGHVENLVPLYVGARVVVLPVIEGAGSAVKTLEAISYGKPIVATSMAVRGVERELSEARELLVHDDAGGYGKAVLNLLSSESLRRSLSKLTTRLYEQHFKMSHYMARIDVPLRQLVNVPPLIMSEPDEQTAEAWVEWSPLIRCVNCLLRNYIDGEPLEGAAIVQLATYPGNVVMETVRTVIDAVLTSSNASLLISERKIRQSLAELAVTDECARFQFLIEAALANHIGIEKYEKVVPHAGYHEHSRRKGQEPPSTAGHKPLARGKRRIAARDEAQESLVAQRHVVADSGLPLLILAEIEGGARVSARLRIVDRNVDSSVETPFGVDVLRAIVPALDFRVARQRVVDVDIRTETGSVVRPRAMAVFHELSMTATPSTLNRPVLNTGWRPEDGRGFASAEHIEGAVGLSVPHVSALGGVSFMDLEFENDRDVIDRVEFLIVNWKYSKLILVQNGGVTVRFMLNSQLPGCDFGLLVVSILADEQTPELRLHSIRSGIVFGDPEQGLEILTSYRMADRMAEQHSEAARTYALHGAADRMLKQVAHGEPSARRDIELVRSVLASDELSGLLADLLGSARATGDSVLTGGSRELSEATSMLRTVLYPGELIQRIGGLICSPLLTFEIVDGAGRLLSGREGQSRFGHDAWHISTDALSGATAVRFRLSALRDRVSGERPLVLQGWHEVEYGSAEHSYRWSASTTESTVLLPVARTQPILIDVYILSVGANTENEDLFITIDGKRVSHSIREQEGDTRRLYVPVAPHESGFSVIEIGLGCNKLITEDGGRALGIAVREMVVTIPLWH